MSASPKLHHLESRISELQTQHELLLRERQQEIATLLTMVDLAHIDDKTLIGGFLFVKEKIITQDSIAEAWHVAGEKFLRQYKPKFSTFHDNLKRNALRQPLAERKQQENCPQAPKQGEIYPHPSGKKDTPPKQECASQTADQSTQECPQSGEA